VACWRYVRRHFQMPAYPARFAGSAPPGGPLVGWFGSGAVAQLACGSGRPLALAARGQALATGVIPRWSGGRRAIL
jgi:hypothetical protein